MTAVTAAALRRSMAPAATARTAATASSAAVPAITRSSVSAVTGTMWLPLARSIRSPSGTARAVATRPATKLTEPITMALAASIYGRRDIAGPGDRERAAGLLDPCRTVVALPIGVSAATMSAWTCSYVVAVPCAGSLAAQADLVEDRGGLGEVHLGSPADTLGHLHVARGGDEEPGLHRGRQPGQGDRADRAPVRAV